MATFGELKTSVATDLRDTGYGTWTATEVGDLINAGIDALADVYPREIASTVGTVAAGTYTYSVSSFMSIYRLEVWTSAGSYKAEMPRGDGSADSGWEIHGGILYLPVGYPLTAGDTLRAFGYARYTQLTADSQTTDLDTSGQWAVRAFCQAKAFGRLVTDRAKFQQWQSNSNATDVTPLGMAQLWQAAKNEWHEERNRLRRMRKA